MLVLQSGFVISDFLRPSKCGSKSTSISKIFSLSQDKPEHTKTLVTRDNILIEDKKFPKRKFNNYLSRYVIPRTIWIPRNFKPLEHLELLEPLDELPK